MENATTLDAYGDHYDDCVLNCPPVPNHNAAKENPNINFLDGKDKWFKGIGKIDKAKYYQVRVTFQSDIFTGLGPELSALAVAWMVP